MGTEVRLKELSLIHIVIVGGPLNLASTSKIDEHDFVKYKIIKLTLIGDFHQLLVKSTLSPLLMQALTLMIRT
ncbi:MAG: hypothetical protein PWQ10_82 [Patescibacteria group bacterium]|nr:hypothetical protein [Patescibacteria group bacterium]